MKKFSKVLAFTMLFVLILGLINLNGKPVSDDLRDKVPLPSLKIEKRIDVGERIEPGQIVTVTVNFTNVGTETAYNPVIKEPSFENFSVINIKGYESRKWIQIAPNATFSYSFQIEFIKEGLYTIERTTITYEDAAKNTYKAYSGFYKLDVTFEEPPVTFDEEWRNIAFWLIAIAIIPGILYLFNKYVFEGRK